MSTRKGKSAPPEPKIAKCPFCGSTECALEEYDDTWRRVECRSCEANGPIRGSDGQPEHERRDDAIRSWNSARRSPAHPKGTQPR